MRALARELGIFIAYGFPERVPGSTDIFDRANLVGPERVLSTYRKRNLVRTTPEHYVFRRGTRLPVVRAGRSAGLARGLLGSWLR